MSDRMEQLLLGGLQLARGAGDNATREVPFEIYALSDEATFGNPIPIRTVIDSILGDGQLVSISRHENREAKFGIRIRSTDGLTLNQAEALLIAETEKPNTLTWVAPDGFAPATVFDVVTSWAEHIFLGDDENNLTRKYILNLSVYPHPRSAKSTTVAAAGSGIDPVDPPTYTTVSACNSLTNWDGRTSPSTQVDALTLNLGHLYLRGDIGWDLWMRWEDGASHNYSATPYVVVDWSTSGSNDPASTLIAFVSNPGTPVFGYTPYTDTALRLVSTGPGPQGGNWRRSIFDLGSTATTVRGLKFYKANDLTSPSGARWALWLGNVSVTAGGAANDGTARQLSRSLEIGGTARAMGAIDVQHEQSLGDILVWSGPTACSPPLRRLRVSGAGEIADTTMVSGAYEDITTEFAAHIPLSSVPSGAYLVMARLTATDTDGEHDVEVRSQTRLDTSETTQVAVGQLLTVDTTVDLVTASYKILPLGVMHLPPSEVASGSDGVARVVISGANVRLDEAWLFNITDGALTFVASADKVLRITSPTLEDPRRRVWTGPSPMALYDAGAKTSMRDEHLFTPGEWAAFTVTTGAQNAAVTVTYDKRWHSNAGEDD